jgi:hypothetical protein
MGYNRGEEGRHGKAWLTMSPNFVKCEKCSKIFAKTEAGPDICPKCSDTVQELPDDPTSQLRLLKNTIRDSQARGEMMTIAQLAEATGLEEEVVWKFIADGEIDTARFDDPMVKEFMQRKRLEREQELRRKGLRGDEDSSSGAATRKPRGGFHIRRDE